MTSTLRLPTGNRQSLKRVKQRQPMDRSDGKIAYVGLDPSTPLLAFDGTKAAQASGGLMPPFGELHGRWTPTISHRRGQSERPPQ